MKQKYLKTNDKDILKIRKHKVASSAWKHILDRLEAHFGSQPLLEERYYLDVRKWKNNYFWRDNRMEDSPLLNNINQSIKQTSNEEDRLYDYITQTKQCTTKFETCPPIQIINMIMDKIKASPICYMIKKKG